MGSRGEGTLPCRAGGGRVPRGQARPWSMGFGESEVSPMACEGSMPETRQGPGVSNRGAQRAPLARWRCITAHILQSALFETEAVLDLWNRT